MKKRYIASVVAASTLLAVKAVNKQKEKEGVKSFKDLTVVRKTVTNTQMSAEKTKAKCKLAVKVAKETLVDIKETYKMDREHIKNGGSLDDLPSRLKKPKVYEEIETPIIVLEDLHYEEDKDLYKDLDEAKKPVAQNN
ncbi:hypothetical protein P4679_24420 [Priestia megaterium]|uniref:hypothetical protein n=1 Tax=Priestia megaterium TaxID=1404 RepID=UPI002E1C1481|nr:hypothetical protein [Priestia megaterium]